MVQRSSRAPPSLEVSSCHHTQGLYRTSYARYRAHKVVVYCLIYDHLLKYLCLLPVSVGQCVNYGETEKKFIFFSVKLKRQHIQ